MTTSTHWPHRQNWRRESKIYALVELGQEGGADPPAQAKRLPPLPHCTTVQQEVYADQNRSPSWQTGDVPVISTDR